MKLTLAEPRYLKESIAIISELVNEVKLNIKKDRIEIVAMDPANVAMVVFKLLSSAFLEYDVPKEQTISVNLDHLKQILKRAKPSDTLLIELDEDKNRLKVQLRGESTRTFHLSLIEIGEKDQKVPELKFPLKIETNTIVFDEAIEDMDVVSDAVSLFADANSFTVSAAGNISEGLVEIGKDEETSIVLDGKGPIKAKYSLEYLKKIIKGSRLADKVTISFNKDYPLKIDYTVMDKLQLTTILAPRVSEED